MKKDVILFVIIFTVLLLISGGTYAYWQWVGTENKVIGFNTSSSIKQYINYNPGYSHFVGDFQPSANYCNDSIYNTISFGKNSFAAEKVFVATLHMDVNSIGSSIKSSNNVYWVVIKGESSGCTGNLSDAVAYGTFKNVNAGSTLTLAQNLPIGQTYETYTVYIWIDESGSNSALSGQTLDVNIWTQIDQTAAWYGDIDLSGYLSTSDVGLLLDILAGKGSSWSQQALKNADVNGDGEITEDDSEALLTLLSQEKLGSTESCKTPALPCTG